MCWARARSLAACFVRNASASAFICARSAASFCSISLSFTARRTSSSFIACSVRLWRSASCCLRRSRCMRSSVCLFSALVAFAASLASARMRFSSSSSAPRACTCCMCSALSRSAIAVMCLVCSSSADSCMESAWSFISSSRILRATRISSSKLARSTRCFQTESSIRRRSRCASRSWFLLSALPASCACLASIRCRRCSSIVVRRSSYSTCLSRFSASRRAISSARRCLSLVAFILIISSACWMLFSFSSDLIL
mmetsp:Transcript_30604/g.58982  ORF Transcript_30604/g.58982 Transcript_30604/m.58982 type:complete len:255 (+) Transcript_30604:1022-1786(+)